MANVLLKGNEIHTAGQLPKVGDKAPRFILTTQDLADVSLDDFLGSSILLNIFPSVDTGTCATAARKFNESASKMPQTKVLCISMDLPFAQKRFCAAENLNNVTTLSAFRHAEFGLETKYGVTILDGALMGLFARAVVVLNPQGEVLYTELVREVSEEPNYEAALRALV